MDWSGHPYLESLRLVTFICSATLSKQLSRSRMLYSVCFDLVVCDQRNEMNKVTMKADGVGG